MKKGLIRMMNHVIMASIFILQAQLLAAQAPAPAADEEHEAPASAPTQREMLKYQKPELTMGGASDVKQLAASTIQAQAQQYITAGNGKITFDQLIDVWSKASIYINKNAAFAALIVNLMPKDLLNKVINKNAGLTDVAINPGPSEFEGSFILSGNGHTSSGKKITVSLMYAPVVPSYNFDSSKPHTPVKGGVSLTIGIPADTPISQLFPSLNTKSLGTVQLTDARCVISDCEYYDQTGGFPISKGLTVVLGINPANIGILNTDKVKKFLQFDASATIYGIASIAPNEQQSEETKKQSAIQKSFKIIAPPHALKISQFKVSQVADLLNVPMPSVVKNELSKIVIQNITVNIDLTQGYENFSIAGVADCFGAKNVEATYKVFKAPLSFKHAAEVEKKVTAAFESGQEIGQIANTVLVNNLTFVMPSSWKVTSFLPQLKALNSIGLNQPTITLTSQSYGDDSTGVDMQRGVTLSGMVDISSFGSNPVLKTLGTILGHHMVLSGVFAADLAASQFNVTIGKDRAKEIKVSLGELVPSTFGKIKSELSKNSFSIGQVDMQFGASDTTKKLRMTGTTTINNFAMPTEFQLIAPSVTDLAKLHQQGTPVSGGWLINLILNIPQKVKGVSEDLDSLDQLPVSNLRLAIIEYPYMDQVNSIYYEKGVNIGGFLGFTGPLSFVKKLLPAKDVTGLNVTGVIGTGANRNLRLEALLPGAGITLSKGTKMEAMRLAVTVGAQPSFGLEGTINTHVPRQFRPKKGRVVTPPADADLATMMDVQNASVAADTAPSESDNSPDTVATQDPATGDLVISEADQQVDTPIDTSDLATVLEDEPPYISDADVDTSAYDQPVGANDELKFMGSINLSGESGVVSCSMDGVVDLMGLILSNVGIMGQIDMLTLVPSGFGFRATMQIQGGQKPKIMNFAAKVSAGATTTSFVWVGDYKGGLYLSDLVSLANTMVRHSPKASKPYKDAFFAALKKVPKVGVDEIAMSIVPEATDIAGTYYEEGISGSCKFVLFGAHGTGAIKMGYTGVSGNGSLDKVMLPRKGTPVFLLSSFDKKTGPSMSFNIGAKDMSVGAMTNEFSLDGDMEIPILGFKEAAKIMLSATGGSFELSNKPIFGIYQVDMSGTLPFTDVYTAEIKGTFKQDSLTKLSKQLKDASQSFIQRSSKDLETARQAVIKEFDGKIAAQREIVKKEREKGTAAISGAEKDAQAKINKEIEDTKNRIKTLEDRDKRFKKECKKANLKSCAEIIKNGTELAAKKAYLEVLLKPGKTVTKGTLEAAKGIGTVVPIDADPRVASLIAAKDAALTGIKVGSESSKSFGQISKAIADMGDNAVNLQLVEVDVKLKDLVHGKLPKFTIKGTFFGKKVSLRNIQLDMRNAPKAIDHLAGHVISNIKL
jgi:hypothetical protein